MAKVKNTKVDSIKKDDVLDFLNYISRKAKSNNVDQFLRNGQLKDINDLFECGKYFLTHAMGCDESDFIPNLKFKEFACYVPVSENYYPWAFFAVPTTTTDLSEFFDHHGRNYLLSADSGKKDFAVVTNFKTLQVFDFNHHQEQYECTFSDLFDSANGDRSSDSFKPWQNFIKYFGPEKAEEGKKHKRSKVVEHIRPKEASPELQFVKRFGHMPSMDTPIGYDGNNFRDTFKTLNLPFLSTEVLDWELNKSTVEKNKLIWGDNLAVMRSLPDESIDLIYIDPPFFSGRNYNYIFGDDDEVRTFTDIWDGGLPTYLAWMNARLWEMKRLLKSSGTLVVHLDWHAAHYVKCELDKIFGYDNFNVELIWKMFSPHVGKGKATAAKTHQNILVYSKNKTEQYYTPRYLPYKGEYLKRARKDSDGRLWVDQNLGKLTDDKIKQLKKEGRVFTTTSGNLRRKQYLDEMPGQILGSVIDDVERINSQSKERVGYETQKPEALIEHIIKMFCPDNGTVGDFFNGGGTTVVTAEKLGRKWLSTDISRIAISVTRDRLLRIYNEDSGIAPINKSAKQSFEIQYHGVYERDFIRELEEKDYTGFILKCYQASEKRSGDYIHGYRDNKAIYVASAKNNLRKNQVEEFHAELSEQKIQGGVILAWNISKELEKYVDDLRSGTNGPDIQLVQVKLVDIDSNEFKGNNIRFINRPAVVIKKTQKHGLTWVFDGTASCGTNGSEIHYFQWDFNFNKAFSSTTRPTFKDSDGDNKPLNDNRRIEYTFPKEGKFKVALRIYDRSGAVDTDIIEINVSSKSQKAS